MRTRIYGQRSRALKKSLRESLFEDEPIAPTGSFKTVCIPNFYAQRMFDRLLYDNLPEYAMSAEKFLLSLGVDGLKDVLKKAFEDIGVKCRFSEQTEDSLENCYLKKGGDLALFDFNRDKAYLKKSETWRLELDLFEGHAQYEPSRIEIKGKIPPMSLIGVPFRKVEEFSESFGKRLAEKAYEAGEHEMIRVLSTDLKKTTVCTLFPVRSELQAYAFFIGEKAQYRAYPKDELYQDQVAQAYAKKIVNGKVKDGIVLSESAAEDDDAKQSLIQKVTTLLKKPLKSTNQREQEKRATIAQTALVCGFSEWLSKERDLFIAEKIEEQIQAIQKPLHSSIGEKASHLLMFNELKKQREKQAALREKAKQDEIRLEAEKNGVLEGNEEWVEEDDSTLDEEASIHLLLNQVSKELKARSRFNNEAEETSGSELSVKF